MCLSMPLAYPVAQFLAHPLACPSECSSFPVGNDWLTQAKPPSRLTLLPFAIVIITTAIPATVPTIVLNAGVAVPLSSSCTPHC